MHVIYGTINFDVYVGQLSQVLSISIHERICMLILQRLMCNQHSSTRPSRQTCLHRFLLGIVPCFSSSCSCLNEWIDSIPGQCYKASKIAFRNERYPLDGSHISWSDNLLTIRPPRRCYNLLLKECVPIGKRDFSLLLWFPFAYTWRQRFGHPIRAFQTMPRSSIFGILAKAITRPIQQGQYCRKPWI